MKSWNITLGFRIRPFRWKSKAATPTTCTASREPSDANGWSTIDIEIQDKRRLTDESDAGAAFNSHGREAVDQCMLKLIEARRAGIDQCRNMPHLRRSILDL